MGAVQNGVARSELTADMARQLLRYDPEVGTFVWKARPAELYSNEDQWWAWNARFAGKPAFTSRDNHGYSRATIFSREYAAHRVAWLIVHGAWPNGPLDHINGVRDDNRIANLRVVTSSQNMRNRVGDPRNTSGINGVSFKKETGRWQAQIKLDGRTRHLGYFATKEEAAVARSEANARHGYSARHGVRS